LLLIRRLKDPRDPKNKEEREKRKEKKMAMRLRYFTTMSMD
jgi:hypothetical protein